MIRKNGKKKLVFRDKEEKNAVEKAVQIGFCYYLLLFTNAKKHQHVYKHAHLHENNRLRMRGRFFDIIPDNMNTPLHNHLHSYDARQKVVAIVIGFVPFGPETTNVRKIPTAQSSHNGNSSDKCANVIAVEGGRLDRRPNPREVSMFLLSTGHSIPSPANSLLMQFGQFISHDFTRNALENTCTCQSAFDQRCANVPRPASDRRTERCMPFTRSFPVCQTGVGNRSREQLNENTAYIDGSVVYSSEAVTLQTLRTGAMLKTNIVNGLTFPPNNGLDSMTVGDDRSTLFVGLAAMHTTFLRLHNNRHHDYERQFQEKEKALEWVITFQEFLPTLIGPFHSRLVPPYVKYVRQLLIALFLPFSFTLIYFFHILRV
uniref:Peroxidase mlt-7 n=1 Tax=Angiostrongylus cantonensis TaxID=6313 RepID=A0A158P6F4_ANGCA